MKHTTCRFPYGDPCKPGFYFCNASVHTRDYCEEHYKKCYVKVPQRDPRWNGARTVGCVFVSHSVSVQQFGLQRGME